MNARRLPAFLALLLALGLPAASRAQTAQNDAVGPMAKVTLRIGDASLNAEIAASSAQQERGLMWRTSMGDNDGMIFLLGPAQTAEFWMKNTLIPLSVAFIDKNGVILEIHDMKATDPSTPDAQLPRYRSDSNQVSYALETNLHWFSLNGIKPGDKIEPPPATLGAAGP